MVLFSSQSCVHSYSIFIIWSFGMISNNCNLLLRKYRLYIATKRAPLRGARLFKKNKPWILIIIRQHENLAYALNFKEPFPSIYFFFANNFFFHPFIFLVLYRPDPNNGHLKSIHQGVCCQITTYMLTLQRCRLTG